MIATTLVLLACVAAAPPGNYQPPPGSPPPPVPPVSPSNYPPPPSPPPPVSSSNSPFPDIGLQPVPPPFLDTSLPQGTPSRLPVEPMPPQDRESIREEIAEALSRDRSWLAKPVAPMPPRQPTVEEVRKRVGGDLHAQTVIYNPSSAEGPIRYLFRWGNSQWQWVNLEPGHHRVHWYKYKFVDEHRAPTLEVYFDRDVSPNNAWITYRLKRWGSPTPDARFGAQYEFVQPEPGSQFLVLKQK